MLYKHVFYLNGLSKEFGKMWAFACMECMYVCMYGMYNLVLGEREKEKEKKENSPAVVSFGRERKERKERKG